MARIVLTLTEWQAVCRELAAAHTATAPPGLLERVQALIAQAPRAWPEQPCALELDDSSVRAVQSVHGALTDRDPAAGQRSASVDEAMRVIRDHQRPS